MVFLLTRRAAASLCREGIMRGRKEGANAAGADSPGERAKVGVLARRAKPAGLANDVRSYRWYGMGESRAASLPQAARDGRVRPGPGSRGGQVWRRHRPVAARGSGRRGETPRIRAAAAPAPAAGQWHQQRDGDQGQEESLEDVHGSRSVSSRAVRGRGRWPRAFDPRAGGCRRRAVGEVRPTA